MKKIVLAAILFACTFAILAPQAASASTVGVSVSFFHDTLAPYGRWTVVARYGEVWIPAGISRGWDPYWDGEWLWTEYGWTWVSYDPWGDIPCHYGTWAWVDPYGWVWVPGTIWAPAWVTWAWTDSYIGWAPVPVSFVISSSGYAGSPVVVDASRYVFVPATQFVGVNASTVRVSESRNAAILPLARKATRFEVSGGIVRAMADPPLDFVQRVSRKRVERSGTGRLKARPTTLATAHVSGRRLPVVAPASERSARSTSRRSIEKGRAYAPAHRSSAKALERKRASAPERKRASAATRRVRAAASMQKKRTRVSVPASSRRPPVVSQRRATFRGSSAGKAPRQERAVVRSSGRPDHRPSPAPPRREPPPAVAQQRISRQEEPHGNPHATSPRPAVHAQPPGASTVRPPKQKERGSEGKERG